MKAILISYSLSGNNAKLAEKIAQETGIKILRLTELKPRGMWTIGWDILTDRTPRINDIREDLTGYDLVIFSGPVWMGHVASPFRAVFKKFRNQLPKYVYLSISGGADGDNEHLESELTQRLGAAPEAVIDLHIADLLPGTPKPERKDTMNYHLEEPDLRRLTKEVLSHDLFMSLAGTPSPQLL